MRRLDIRGLCIMGIRLLSFAAAVVFGVVPAATAAASISCFAILFVLYP